MKLGELADSLNPRMRLRLHIVCSIGRAPWGWAPSTHGCLADDQLVERVGDHAVPTKLGRDVAALIAKG